MASVRCPKCDDAALLPLDLGEILLDRCESCGGIWFDHGELEAVVGLTAAARQEPIEPEPAGGGSGPCPRCTVEMRPVSAGEDPDRPVRVDRCPSCMGLWLDRRLVRPIEDQRLPCAVHSLFVDAQADDKTVAALPDEQKELVRKAADLLRSHPKRAALLTYLERRIRDAEAGSCTPVA
jgi:Zn-finger nucleic acid-binding protein